MLIRIIAHCASPEDMEKNVNIIAIGIVKNVKKTMEYALDVQMDIMVNTVNIIAISA